jgi:hypothetical protein
MTFQTSPTTIEDDEQAILAWNEDPTQVSFFNALVDVMLTKQTWLETQQTALLRIWSPGQNLIGDEIMHACLPR